MMIVAVFIILGGGIFYYLNSHQTSNNENQIVLEKTLKISKEYVALRHQTDNVLLKAKEFADYDAWNKEMLNIIQQWEILGKEAMNLEKIATEMTEEKIGFNLINSAIAYNQQEISNIFDKAPAGKKIATLAKHLGVDAKKAFQILKQDQAQVEANAWNEAGDTFQKLETTAVVIKDACKVVGFIGGVAISGGTSVIMTGSALTKATVIVSGADLALEITDDGAKIALGNQNKISSFTSDIRIVTEPIANILTITDLPNNLKTGFEKFNAVMIGLENFRSPAQEGKIIGINLPAYNPNKKQDKIKVTAIEPLEVEKWLEDHKISNDFDINDETEKTLETTLLEEGELIDENKNNNKSIVGEWEGSLIWKISGDDSESTETVNFSFLEDGRIDRGDSDWDMDKWELKGDTLIVYGAENIDGHYEFKVIDNNTIIFVKAVEPEDPEVESSDIWFTIENFQVTLKRK